MFNLICVPFIRRSRGGLSHLTQFGKLYYDNAVFTFVLSAVAEGLACPMLRDPRLLALGVSSPKIGLTF